MTIFFNSCTKENFPTTIKNEETGISNKISYADLMLAVNSTNLVKIQTISSQSLANSTIDSFDIDPIKILQTSNIKNEVFYSMRLIPKARESRHYFYNLYFKKDSLGKITKTIVKFSPTIETIKNGYKNFRGKSEILKELQTSTGQIKSSSTDLKPQLVCVEVAFDIPCEYGFVHSEGDGLGSWCDGSGSRRDYLNDCTSGGGSGSGTAGSGSPNNGGGTNVLITPNGNLNIIVCENSEADNFIMDTYNANKAWADSHLTEFNQIVGDVCSELTDDNKFYIKSTIEYLNLSNGILEEKVDETTDMDIFDPTARIDTSIYSEYTNSMVWPNTSILLSNKNFIGWMYPGISKNCFEYAKKQIAILGWRPGALNTSSHLQIYSNNNVVNSNVTKDAVGYLIYALKKGIPVIVGVDDQSGSSNSDLITDHFIVIMGSGTDAIGKYFKFYDNAANYLNPTTGISSDNKLYYKEQQGIITGKSQTGYAQKSWRHDYIVTQVRKSVK